MDQIDINLAEAWNRVGAACKHDFREALRRFARTQRAVFTRPPREWCVVVRAADARISAANAIISFDSEKISLGLDEGADEALARGVPHTVTLSAPTIRALTKPVFIPWPGSRVAGGEAAGHVAVVRQEIRQTRHAPIRAAAPAGAVGAAGRSRSCTPLRPLIPAPTTAVRPSRSGARSGRGCTRNCPTIWS